MAVVVLLAASAVALAALVAQEPSVAMDMFTADDECLLATPVAADTEHRPKCALSVLQRRAANTEADSSAQQARMRADELAEERPRSVPRRLKIFNGCASAPIWIAHMATAAVGPDPQDVKIEPGGVYDFSTPSHLMATRYWPKMGCDHSGHNCSIGSSGGPAEACKRNPITGEDDYKRCAPPVDTKFEASFGQNGEPCNPQAPGGTQMKGCDFVDISLVDGWTLPVKFDVVGDCKTNKDKAVHVIDCSGLSLDACPADEALTAAGLIADLRAIDPITKQVSGCYSPCAKLLDTKWSNKERPHGRRPEDPGVSPYCCPTPPQSPESCRVGPITGTRFLKAVHERCPGVYGYAYDDGMGLMRCSSATIYMVTFYCPDRVPV